LTRSPAARTIGRVTERDEDDREEPRHDEEDREAILRRRAVFVASALAGIAISGCDSEPWACLKVPHPPTSEQSAASASASASAAPVASPPVPPTAEPPASASGPASASASASASAAPRPPRPPPPPRPCLNVKTPDPPPMPCLKQAPLPPELEDPKKK